MAYYVAAYRIAMLVSSGIVVGFVAYLQYAGVDKNLIWPIGYVAMAALILIGLVGALLAEEPARKEAAEAASAAESAGNPLTRFFAAAYAAFADFLSKRDALLILLFVVIYKLTDTFAGVMTGPFVLDIGFDKASYAAIIKGVGFVASLVGGFAGGLLARAVPLSRALLIAGILQALANFGFSWVAWLGVNHAALTFAITAENFTSAIGTVVFVAYLSALCTNRAYTATQFALLTALSAFGRTQLAAITGYVAAAVGWFWFFALCAAAAIPGLLLLWLLMKRGDFESIERKEHLQPA
jgi:PAT family beta-lactamase induction signal transducer AmpG